MELSHVHIGLSTLSVYRDLLDQPVLVALSKLSQALETGDGLTAAQHYSQLFYEMQRSGSPSLGHWLYEALRWSQGPYPTAMAKGDCPEHLEYAAKLDIDTLRAVSAIPSQQWLDAVAQATPAQLRPLLSQLLPWPDEPTFSLHLAPLRQAYLREGVGLLARHKAFVWEDGTLIPVPHPDCPTSEQLMGYEHHRNQVVQNTRALLAGKYVNNVLLYGESGTGKSATVKHLLTLPGMEQLRLIEADKENLSGLPALIRSLEGQPLKFIIFIDDLTFDRDDPTYSVLKTILEGGVERRPQNVAIYATSNRRHLVRQTISERAGDEMDRNETIREKTSLADRFGLRILYQGLSRGEFLDLVDLFAAQHGCTLPQEQLHQRAIAWERHHGSTTPRTALQFVLSL
ncbi:ATP-binding protein [Pseudoflavonifractor sp. An187]|uniref:ATP-binding protein n=1 Tax=Pseudoflavonifractor sp. An187 TaxID=1965578 RepID=UPI000B36A9E1|nr:ATP-binding protein [Pseudoflavonifractor sp. An187]OUP45141.1 hypothetical protein B5F22_05040 [Pseudoflavonifractor sp. An187]